MTLHQGMRIETDLNVSPSGLVPAVHLRPRDGVLRRGAQRSSRQSHAPHAPIVVSQLETVFVQLDLVEVVDRPARVVRRRPVVQADVRVVHEAYKGGYHR